MHKMHHIIEYENWILQAGGIYMHETDLGTVAMMDMDQGASNWVRDFREQGAPTCHLPKSVRFLGEVPAAETRQDPCAAMYEFEVVTGNAAYREGERFYLTPAQAQRVYLILPPDHQ